jgi:hypothetical protein
MTSDDSVVEFDGSKKTGTDNQIEAGFSVLLELKPEPEQFSHG